MFGFITDVCAGFKAVREAFAEQIAEDIESVKNAEGVIAKAKAFVKAPTVRIVFGIALAITAAALLPAGLTVNDPAYYMYSLSWITGFGIIAYACRAIENRMK